MEKALLTPSSFPHIFKRLWVGEAHGRRYLAIRDRLPGVSDWDKEDADQPEAASGGGLAAHRDVLGKEGKDSGEEICFQRFPHRFKSY